MTLIGLVEILSTTSVPSTQLPGGLSIDASTHEWVQVLLIMIGTFILEDPTCVAVGLLIRSGVVDPVLGIVSVIVGVFLGDLGLYGLGWYGGSAISSRQWFKKRFPESRLEKMQGWFHAHGWTAIIASRFMPGTRVPLYVAIGFARGNIVRFMVWTAIAVVVWVPVIVLGTAWLGGTILEPVESVIGEGVLAWIVVGVLLLIILHIVSLSLTREGRSKMRSILAWLFRWKS